MYVTNDSAKKKYFATQSKNRVSTVHTHTCQNICAALKMTDYRLFDDKPFDRLLPYIIHYLRRTTHSNADFVFSLSNFKSRRFSDQQPPQKTNSVGILPVGN